MDADEKDGEGEDGGGGPKEEWFLVDGRTHKKFRLPKTMLFLGHDECDVVVQSDSVDKRHAVVTFDHYLCRFKIKDLSTANGTYVNESRIPEQEYVTLNHMDSVRLGYDSMVYHVEQGGPATDPMAHLHPGEQPLHPHTHPGHGEHSHIHPGHGEHSHMHPNHGEHPHLHPTPEEQLPGWANREPSCIDMAECEVIRRRSQMVYNQIARGCIAEQQIQHTCVHHTHQDSHFVDMHRSFGKKEPEDESKHGLGSNTWPKKRLRQVRHHPHVASIFSEDSHICESVDQSESTIYERNNRYCHHADHDGPHRPHCEHSMYEERDGVNVPTCMCYANNNADYLDYAVTNQTNGVTRIPRSQSGSGKHLLPAELETVKKGSSLYGQPAWWGEEESDATQTYQSPPGSKRSSLYGDTDEKTSIQSGRPRSLSLEQKETLSKMESNSGSDPDYGIRYMEIPAHRILDSEREKETPPRSMSSSISKDSLFSDVSKLNTPDTPGDRAPSKEGTPDRRGRADSTPDRRGRCTPDRIKHVDTTPMAFTIDFGDDDKKDKAAKSLSECVPPKIRKSFRERKEMAKEKKEKKEKEATPNKSEEEGETSPTQLKKSDDASTCSSLSDSKPPRRVAPSSGKRASVDNPALKRLSGEVAPPSSKRSSTDNSVLKRLSGEVLPSSSKRSSTDNSVLKRLSGELAPNGSKRSSTDSSVLKRLSGEKSPPTKLTENGETSKTDTGTYTKSTRSTRSKKSPSATRSTTKSPKSKPSEPTSIDPAQYKNPTNFLIDKMFEGNGKVTKKPVPPTDQSYVPLTEHDMYRESIDYDVNTKHNGDSNGEVSSANNLQNQKSKDKLVVKEEDKASEAGTYTIEAEDDSKEEEEARKNIDRVFGLDDSMSLDRPVIDADREADSDGREITESAELALKRSFRDRGSSMEVEAGSADTMEDLDIPDDIDLEDLSLAAMSTTDVPKWVSQWAALAKQKALKKTQSLDLEEGHNNLKESSSQKPPNGRKRPGTGRKLPSIPPTDRSPCSSDYSANIGDLSPRSGDVTPRQEDLSDFWPIDSPTKPKSVTISSQVVTHYKETNGDASTRGRSGSASDMNGDSTARTSSPDMDSSRTTTSMDTEVLLKDTVTVMAAMEARMASRSIEKQTSALNGLSPSDNLDDSDTDSMVALVNGDDKFVKPTTYSSPRASLAKRSTPKNTSTPKKPPLGKSMSVRDQTPVKSSSKNRSYSLDNSGTSDIYSESSELGDSESYRSDVSSETVPSSVSKKDSKKGLITNTKPNRAFALRRAKADGPEETSRSSRSNSSTASTPRGSSARSTSSSRAHTVSSAARNTARSKSTMSGRFDSGKSEASLGAEIVKKSRENAKTPDANFDRKDGGRHSLRSSYKTNSQKTLSLFNPTEAARRTELKVLKSQLRKSEGSKGLSVSGHAARSQSQPGSRSNSPKAAERKAWQRRKEYDPRKAVAEAKAKSKSSVPRHKPLSKSQTSLAYTSKMMIRSASFTNSAELSGRSSDSYRNGSISSAEDISLSEVTDTFNERGIGRRAFIPLSGPLRGERVSHSADEDDSLLSVASAQDISCSMLGKTEYKSAFTPPLQKLKSPSTSTISPLPSTARSRRRTLDSIEYEENNNRKSGGDSPQSYDTLLITSIYQLSLKLKTATDRTLNKLRDNNRVSATPSPIDDFLGHNSRSDIPAWKSANQELAGILKNLRRIEHHQQVMERALFPDEDSPTEVSGISSREKQKYFQEIERIRSELQGFHFIDKPECEEGWKKQESVEEMSPDMEEIEEEFY